MEYREDARRDGDVGAKKDGDDENGYERGSWGTAGSEGDWMRLLRRNRQGCIVSSKDLEREEVRRQLKGLGLSSVEKPVLSELSLSLLSGSCGNNSGNGSGCPGASCSYHRPVPMTLTPRSVTFPFITKQQTY